MMFNCLLYQVTHRAPNEIDYRKKIQVQVYSVFFFFLWQCNYTWECHHLFLEWLWVFKDSSKFGLDENQEIYVQIMSLIL